MPHFINVSLSNLKIYPAMPQGRLQCILVLGQISPFDITYVIKTYEYSLLFFFFLPFFFFKEQKINKDKNIYSSSLVGKKSVMDFFPLRSDTLYFSLENTGCSFCFFVFNKKIIQLILHFSNYSEYSALQCNPRQVNYTKYLGGIPFCTAHL